uniref:Uncharacterized protein n=1 Tax=Cacopsylla melanoneura TaxID=428564 RepID=A0A8D8UJM1_9HEMI
MDRRKKKMGRRKKEMDRRKKVVEVEEELRKIEMLWVEIEVLLEAGIGGEICYLVGLPEQDFLLTGSLQKRTVVWLGLVLEQGLWLVDGVLVVQQWVPRIHC